MLVYDYDVRFLQLNHQHHHHFITALHGMQTRSSDENSVCPSVCHTRVL